MFEELAKKLAKELMEELNVQVPDHFQKLFAIDKKSELIKYCKTLRIETKDFAMLVHNCHKIGYHHAIKRKDFTPSHLHPADNEVKGMASSKSGEPLSSDAEKFIRKVSQIFKQRRILVAHIFFSQAKWHIFYFDQRDLEDFEKNHWGKGSHVHFVNYLWPGYDPSDLWALFDKADGTVGGNIHIRHRAERD
jgi:hypothetical protein